MLAADPQLQLETLFLLNDERRILSTREPLPSPGPSFILIRGASTVAWAIRADIDDDVAAVLRTLVAQEPASATWDELPLHARRYQELLNGPVRWGPAFSFPERLRSFNSKPVSTVEDETLLSTHFSGWVAGEIAAGGAPMLAISDDGHPVSVCFCARRSTIAAEAGLETAPAFRGRGYAPCVTVAWANAVRERGLTPLYSTDWSNLPSLAVARKLELVPYATDWSIG